jgi:hypothetical protein
MYLARVPDKKLGWRYIIRQSYAHGGAYRSRDLFELGDDPSRFIVYPGGNGFYIDTTVEESIAAQGISVSQDDLEPVFMPFLAPHIRRVIDGFDRTSRHRRDLRECPPADAHHRFDRYRLHFLKTGRVSHREMGCTPDRFYARLDRKSRDEIEYDFIRAERRLKSGEMTLYTYQIFDLQRHFSEQCARTHPEALDQGKMDRFFIRTLCELNRDRSFWMAEEIEESLQPHLVRYAVMYFDNAFPLRDPFGDFLKDFMNRHRMYHPPESVRVNLEESARLFGVSSERLKKMDCRTLTRRYRNLAQTHHPDKGGDPEGFIRLNAAYRKLMKRKSKQ